MLNNEYRINLEKLSARYQVDYSVLSEEIISGMENDETLMDVVHIDSEWTIHLCEVGVLRYMDVMTKHFGQIAYQVHDHLQKLNEIAQLEAQQEEIKKQHAETIADMKRMAASGTSDTLEKCIKILEGYNDDHSFSIGLLREELERRGARLTHTLGERQSV